MILHKFKRFINRCVLFLTPVLFGAFLSYGQQASAGEPYVAWALNKAQPQSKVNYENDIPIGLFAYNKWVDLNDNELVERNEFFGLGKQSFSKGESIKASLNDPSIADGANLKLRIWDTSGNLIRTVRKKYTSNRMFTYSDFDSFLPVGNYILTINPEDSGNTYQIEFSLMEPNGNSFSKIRKKLLPESFHLFHKWIDEDGDMKIDSTEVTGLNKNEFEVGNIDFEVGLNLPSATNSVVYQVWDPDHKLLSMNISKMDSLQHFTMKSDSLNQGNDFLKILSVSPPGTYTISAFVNGETLKSYQLQVQIVDVGGQTLAGQGAQETPQSAAGKESDKETVPAPAKPKMAMNVTERVENLAPAFAKGLEGFFFFTGFIDLNENNKQERDEFMGTVQDYYYSESENVFAQFHLAQYQDAGINLKIYTEDEELVKEQIASYEKTPFVFKVSTPDEPLVPGDYKLIAEPEKSDVRYRLKLSIK